MTRWLAWSPEAEGDPKNAEYAQILDEVVGPDLAQGPRCDDCRKVYDEPYYYTFEPDGCRWYDDVWPNSQLIAHDCTGNTCPDCSDSLTPDDPTDPRRSRADIPCDDCGRTDGTHDLSVEH